MLALLMFFATLVPGLAAADSPHADKRAEGSVVDARTGEPIEGALLEIRGERVARTGKDGAFAIGGVSAQGEPLSVEASGYLQRAITVEAGDEFVIELSPDGEIIEITAAVPELGEPTSYQLDAETVRSMPGTAGDTLKAVQSLPGAARIPFGFGGISLRGTEPRDTKVHLDGVEVPILYHFGGLTSFYPSSLLDSLEVMPGGYGAAHGRGQGGLVTLGPRDARRDGWRMGGHVSLLDASVFAEGPTAGDGGLIAGLRRSYIDGLLALASSEQGMVLPRYLDGQLRWTHGDPNTGQWTASVFVSEDRLGLREENADTSLRLGFARAAATYRRRLGDLELTALGWLGGDQLRFRFEGDDEEALGRRLTVPGGARADLLRDFSAGYLAAGLDVQAARYGVAAFDSEDESFDESSARYAGDVGVWTEARYRSDGGYIGITPGVRLDYFGLTGEWQVAPRLTMTQTLHPRFTVRETVGLYHQPPNEIELHDEPDQDLRSSRAAHMTLGGDLALPTNIDVQLTGYLILGDRQAVGVTPPSHWDEEPPSRSSSSGGFGPVFDLLLEEQFGSGEYRESVGYARSYGLEVGAKRRAKSWMAMVSYTLSRAERTDDPERFSDWRPYELDQTHNFVAMVSKRFSRWQLGARLRYTTGNPYNVEFVDQDGAPVATVSDRLPDFVQLDMRADYRWQPRWGSGTMKAFADVQNIGNRRNAEGVSYQHGGPSYTRGLPVLPILGLEYEPAP